jgi:hypothetical protein
MPRGLLKSVRKPDQLTLGPRPTEQLRAHRELLADKSHRHDDHGVMADQGPQDVRYSDARNGALALG